MSQLRKLSGPGGAASLGYTSGRMPCHRLEKTQTVTTLLLKVSKFNLLPSHLSISQQRASVCADCPGVSAASWFLFMWAVLIHLAYIYYFCTPLSLEPCICLWCLFLVRSNNKFWFFPLFNLCIFYLWKITNNFVLQDIQILIISTLDVSVAFLQNLAIFSYNTNTFGTSRLKKKGEPRDLQIKELKRDRGQRVREGVSVPQWEEQKTSP